MAFKVRSEAVDPRRIRERNTVIYRFAHWPIWIWVFFLAPGPLTFDLFAHGFGSMNLAWMIVVLVGTGIAGLFGQLPGVEPRPYILRFTEDKSNPLYRKICYTFAWNAVISFALLNLSGLVAAVITGQWLLMQMYRYAYFPLCLIILVLGGTGVLPRTRRSTKGEGIERRYFYGAVWTVTIAQIVLLVLWKQLPLTPASSAIKLAVYVAVLALIGSAAALGKLPRTRPILPGELITAD
jgi:energy-converting hydrogenase Eha subunit C